MKDDIKSSQKQPGGPVPHPADEAEHLYEDLFVAPPPIAPAQADTSYLHQKRGFFARLFRIKTSPEIKKAA